MLEAIADIGKEVDSADIYQQLLRHISLIQKESKAGALIDIDRERISDYCEKLREAHNLMLSELSA
jgi:hypothetical protein